MYLEQRQELHEAEAKARDLRQRFASAGIAGSVSVVFAPEGHPKLHIQLERPQDKAAANKLAADCVRD